MAISIANSAMTGGSSTNQSINITPPLLVTS